MSTKFSPSDKKFLKSAGVSAEPAFEETRLELAKRIAKHQAPVQVKVDPDAARFELIRLAMKKLLAAAEAREPGDEDDE